MSNFNEIEKMHHKIQQIKWSIAEMENSFQNKYILFKTKKFITNLNQKKQELLDLQFQLNILYGSIQKTKPNLIDKSFYENLTMLTEEDILINSF